MAMSEDYTCIISCGPNLRTKHIPMVESCGDVLLAKIDNGDSATGDGDVVQTNGFLNASHACNKQLGPSYDIFIYRC
ncbi:hypothetical protein GUJ93_ZPchr0004g38381 [Zizania palustris]|uniref:FLZ-type domain-containing protein n=1 Tax=Zizania palustris TaxID=103762 RepID=A0A8J5V8V0_ZIZPA|nr:hypothetical protein GUJ93_ZPchr0004g38381 [Zizania palustris]